MHVYTLKDLESNILLHRASLVLGHQTVFLPFGAGWRVDLRIRDQVRDPGPLRFPRPGWSFAQPLSLCELYTINPVRFEGCAQA